MSTAEMETRPRAELLLRTKSLGEGQGNGDGPSFTGQVWRLLVHRLDSP